MPLWPFVLLVLALASVVLIWLVLRVGVYHEQVELIRKHGAGYPVGVHKTRSAKSDRG